jgi:uncharacterized protein YjiS (DUF1127 family)
LGKDLVNEHFGPDALKHPECMLNALYHNEKTWGYALHNDDLCSSFLGVECTAWSGYILQNSSAAVELRTRYYKCLSENGGFVVRACFDAVKMGVAAPYEIDLVDRCRANYAVNTAPAWERYHKHKATEDDMNNIIQPRLDILVKARAKSAANYSANTAPAWERYHKHKATEDDMNNVIQPQLDSLVKARANNAANNAPAWERYHKHKATEDDMIFIQPQLDSLAKARAKSVANYAVNTAPAWERYHKHKATEDDMNNIIQPQLDIMAKARAAQEVKWELSRKVHIDYLRLFKAKNGHLNIPVNKSTQVSQFFMTTGTSLNVFVLLLNSIYLSCKTVRSWIDSQRHKQVRKKLTQAHRQELLDLGFTFTNQVDAWMKKYSSVLEYHKQYKRLPPPKHACYQWMQYQRRRALSSLSQHQIDLLRAIGVLIDSIPIQASLLE